MQIAIILLELILQMACSVVISGACIVFLHCFYDPGFQWGKKKAVIYTIYHVVDMVTLIFVTNEIGLMIWGVLAICIDFWIVIYDYKGKRIRGIFRYAWVSFIILLCTSLISESASPYLFPSYKPLDLYVSDAQVFVTYGLMLAFFGAVLLYLYYCVYKKGVVLRFRKREKLFAIAYSVVYTFLAVTLEICGKNSSIVLGILGVTFVLASVLIPVFFYYLQISKHYQTLTRHQEAHIQAELAHFQQYQQSQEETARFRHDIKNHLLCISDMLENNKTDEAAAYLKDLLENVERSSQKHVTGDTLLDSIVGVKMQRMESENIRFELDGVLAGGLPWKPMDICNVFANALDNAIEACQKVAVADRRIAMNIRSTAQFWFVTIENSVAEPVDVSRLFLKSGGYTSKANAPGHGIGTYNMKHTVESYGAILEAQCDENTFKLEIMIDKSSPE